MKILFKGWGQQGDDRNQEPFLLQAKTNFNNFSEEYNKHITKYSFQ